MLYIHNYEKRQLYLFFSMAIIVAEKLQLYHAIAMDTISQAKHSLLTQATMFTNHRHSAPIA